MTDDTFTKRCDPDNVFTPYARRLEAQVWSLKIEQLIALVSLAVRVDFLILLFY